MEVEKYLQSTFKQLFITVIIMYTSVIVSAENTMIKGSWKQTCTESLHIDISILTVRFNMVTNNSNIHVMTFNVFHENT